MDCTISGALPNMLINPGDPSNTTCLPTSVLVFGQSISVPVTIILEENGDNRRVGVRFSNGTHRGQLAKAAWPGCSAPFGPASTIATAFAGRHVALVDKEERPICVGRSRLNLSTYNQTISAGLALDVSNLTRAIVRDSIARRLDLEIARNLNAILQPSSNTREAGFVGRAGRCPTGYRPFTGD